MSIQRKPFGSIPGIGEIEKITIREGRSEVSVLTLGASLNSFRFTLKDGRVREIVSGSESVESYVDDSTYKGQVVAPFANRIRDAVFTLNGERFILDRNNGKNNLHSGSANTGYKVWNVLFECENGVVIDNPPFSLFTKIVQFYCTRNVPFFLFGPGLTIGTCFRWCTAIFISDQIRFSNGAMVRCNFASNLFGDAVAYSCPELARILKNCPSQNQKANLPKYRYPDELCSASDMQTLAKGDYDFIIHRDECQIVRDLDHHPKASGLFGDHLLLSSAKAAAKAAAIRAIPVTLSDKEKRIISRLANHDNPENYPMPEGYKLEDFE